MDTCHYCQKRFHPMGVFTSTSQRIYACQLTVITNDRGDIEDVEQGSECMDKAIADGFTYRPDLTPRR